MSLALKEIHPVAHATERQLVGAVREGDDRAFEQLFARYRRRISAYVYGLVNDHGRAEDITQEVFISALRRLRETERPISFKPWIYEIARNACIDEFRRVNRASLVSLEAESEPDGLAPRQLADHSTPEVRWERKQQMGDLFGAFSSLPDNQHRILVLRELEGLSYGEIGARMGMSRPMVESTLFRARRRLTQEYDELASGRRCLEVRGAVDGREARGLATLGIRERRRISRHLHHCQDCLRYARMAGVDDAALRVPGPARRVAGLLPFGWLRLAWHRAGAKLGRRGTAAAHRASALAKGSPQSAAAGRAAAAAAVLLIAGGGITAIADHGHASAPAAAAAVSAAVPNWSPASAERVLLEVPHLVAPGAGAARTRTTPSRLASSGPHGSRTGAGSGSSGSTSRSASQSGAGSSTARASGVSLPSAPGTPRLPLSTGGVKGVVSGVLNTLPGAVPAIRQPLGQITSTTTKTVSGVISKVPVLGSGSGPSLPPAPLPTGPAKAPSISTGATGSSVTTPSLTTPSVPVPGGSAVTIPATSVPGPGVAPGKITLP